MLCLCKTTRAVLALGLLELICGTAPRLAIAQEKPLHAWRLTQPHIQDQVITPVHGVATGRVIGPVPIVWPKSGSFVIGRRRDQGERSPISGQMESAGVFESVLSAAEIAARCHSLRSEFPQATGALPQVTGWPTYRRDSQRTALSREELELPLHPLWLHQHFGVQTSLAFLPIGE